ncbi:uncharacterized protein LOC107640820 [Arachis ipaensis]|uniref:uncharacterized protein LOC107640820 n=1 Tax=Arachis ipaensis TaxID=130454 RepID=UPI0007AF61D9|nr:uncharacterized protein LOC107640820 [Arachis ipaensis]
MHSAYSLAILNIEPKCYEDAILEPCWREAILAELDALNKNKTWTLTSLLSGKKVIGRKWIFKVKYHPDARNTAVILALAAVKRCHLKQIDVNTTFLHSELDEEVYMKPPEGLAIAPGQACKLEKSLYGLKQASRQWNFKLKSVLIELGYNQCKSDYSMFTKSQSTGFTVILVYVDDLVLAGDDLLEIERVKQTLHDRFRIKDIGDLRFFLGLEVARSSKGIALYQRKYILDLLRDTGFEHCKPASTPMDYGAKLSKDDGDSLPDSSDYRKIIGKRLYLSNTRPDISFAIGKLSQFLDCPITNHLQAAHRILRYIKNSPAAELFFSANSDLSLTGFSDSDLARCPDSRRSVSAYCFYVGSSLITLKSKK